MLKLSKRLNLTLDKSLPEPTFNGTCTQIRHSRHQKELITASDRSKFIDI